MTTKPGVRALALTLAAISIVAAAFVLDAAWNWWRNSDRVSATVIWASADDGTGNTLAEVDYDGIRATVELNGVVKVGDVVEVFFDPTNREKLKSNSDVVELFAGGMVLFALGVGTAICVLAYGRRHLYRIGS